MPDSNSQYSYSFQNQKRDLGDELSTVIAQESRIIQLFPLRSPAKSRTHEWLEDQIDGTRCVVNGAVSDSKVPVSATDLAKLQVGTTFHIDNDTALFRVTAIDSANNKATVTRVGANGSETTMPSNGDTLVLAGTPMKEGSEEGPNKIHQSGVNYNYTQIFRYDVQLSGTAIAIDTYGIENNIQYQTNLRLGDFVRDLNSMALYGVPVQATVSANGAAGGLFYFGTQDGGLYVDASGTAFDSFLVNDAAQAVAGQGGNPTVIICGIGQARVLSADMRNHVTIVRGDETRGTFVANVVNDVTGGNILIFADKGIPDTQAFVVDPSGFGLVPLNGRSVSDKDSTPDGYDGIRRTIIGEYTLEFKNALQRICWIKGLQASATALVSRRANIQKVDVMNTQSAPVFTKEVSAS